MAALVSAQPGASLLAKSWRITWFLAPLTQLYFSQVTLWGVLVNLVAIPVFSVWLIPGGVFAWCTEGWLGSVVWAPARIGGELLLDLAKGVSRLPAWPASSVMGIAVFSLLSRVFAPRFKWAGVGIPAGVAGLFLVLQVLPPSSFERIANGPIERRAWVAFGSERQPGLVRFISSANGALEGRVCLEAASTPPKGWGAFLKALGVRRVVVVAGEGLLRRQLLSELERRGLWSPEESPVDCSWPDPARVRVTLRACRWRGLSFSPVVREGRRGGPPECASDRGWRALTELGPLISG